MMSSKEPDWLDLPICRYCGCPLPAVPCEEESCHRRSQQRKKMNAYLGKVEAAAKRYHRIMAKLKAKEERNKTGFGLAAAKLRRGKA